jgi:hypothetical protein
MDLPADDALRWIVRSYARLLAAHGEAIGSPRLVQPNGDFFPDEFRHDGPSVARLFRRMVTHSPLADDLEVHLAFVEPEGGAGGGGGCGSPACDSASAASAQGARVRPVEDTGDGYRVFVSVADVGHPDVLTASLARAIGALVLREGDADDLGDRPGGSPPAASEVAATACGFGVLLANGAAVWAKSCGGLRVARATLLSVEELAVALALFAAVNGTPASEVRAHLPGATQREALEHAVAWVESNPLLVEALRDRPSDLASGRFDIEPVRGAIGRWFQRRKLEKEMRAATPPSPMSSLSEEKRRRLAEARALVDDVLGEE